jgi:crossover junction endodeoxyribonuclease RuvC
VRILGVDPGSTVTGYGVIERQGRAIRCIDCGTIRCSDRALSDRLLTVYEGLAGVVAEYGPTEVAIEKSFLGKNVKTLAVMSQARGVLLLAARQAGLPIFEYTPREIKQSVVGTGRASKSQIAYMVHTLLELPGADLPRDATDGLAVALCHLNRERVARAGDVAQRGASTT